MSAITVQTLLKTSAELHEQVARLANDLSIYPEASIDQVLTQDTGSQDATADLLGLWKTRNGSDPIEKAKINIIGLAQQLEKLTLGPQGFIHELVSMNWEHGALYVALELGVLEAIPEDGGTRSFAEIAAPLVSNKGFSSWVGFQLYETRLASANLADWLKQPSDYFAGPAAFDLAVAQDGNPPHPWEKSCSTDGLTVIREGLDAGNEMVFEWFGSQSEIMADPKTSVVVVAGKSIGAFAERMAAAFPEVKFELRDTAPSEVDAPGAFRRRDVTLMTMHNAQQRTAKQWLDLMKKAESRFQISYKEKFKSHSCRGMWEIRIRDHH
ncbi:hypothetical protein J7T55_004718 [Diaporthe amygdali]|uniref:uncharacterized protein n=1 Tax=Phomopsis amygdali TaxID=1214568 RepID=UPI0022FE5CA2|nr:uncharacterized protein J7T55_004718 [Diaporthe amygdali]KAJ0114475.1 hypothetical protein J7T55_004718 [Diaporthe amygdali]